MGEAPSTLHRRCRVWREGRSGRYANPCHGYRYEHRSARTYPYPYPRDTCHVTHVGYPYPWYSLCFPLWILQLLRIRYAAPAPRSVFPFTYLSYGHWSIPSRTILVFLFMILSSRFFLVHAPHFTVYKTPTPVSCSLASSTQFSLVSSLPRFALRPVSSTTLSSPGMVLLGCCNSS